MSDDQQPDRKPLGFFDPRHLPPGPSGRSRHWILKDRIAYPCHNLYEWCKWFETGERRVAYDAIEGVCEVSTVFLGLDHNFQPGGPPILFETLVFLHEGGTGSMERYSLYDEALLGHQRLLRIIKAKNEAQSHVTIEALLTLMYPG